jgi:hypothetical protein
VSYQEDHAGAYADILETGQAVTLTRTAKTHTPSTDAMTTSRSEIAGAAVQVKGTPKAYAALGLVESEAPTLLFAAATYGDAAQLGDELEWNSKTVRVKSIDPTAPDGTPIVARLVVAR